MSDRDELADLIEGQGALLSTGSDQQDWFRAREIALAVHASDWLRDHDRQVRRDVAEEIAQAIEGRGQLWGDPHVGFCIPDLAQIAREIGGRDDRG